MHLSLYLLNREYALRRVRDYFREKKCLTAREDIHKEYQYGLDSLSLLHRQVCATCWLHCSRGVVSLLRQLLIWLIPGLCGFKFVFRGVINQFSCMCMPFATCNKFSYLHTLTPCSHSCFLPLCISAVLINRWLINLFTSFAH